ncbi:GNAT family N-acetyltransferase [Phycisphaeraceae bacterium D3-23]
MSTPTPLFKINVAGQKPIRDTMIRASRPIVERALRFPAMNAIYEAIQAKPEDTRHFADKALDHLGVELDVLEEQLGRIPKTGPVVLVANHPFGGIEGLILTALLHKHRPDSKLLANAMLAMIPELRDSFFFVDAFEGKEAVRNNLASTRNAMRWVAEGHLLGVFPAGEVSHLKLRKRAVIDPKWNPIVARILQKTGAAAVPVFFDGYNSKLFQAAGLIHPRLRTVMLPTEMLRKRKAPVSMRIGSPITPQRMARFDKASNLTDYLRVRTYLLKPEHKREAVETTDKPKLQRIIDPVPQEQLVDALADLPDKHLLLQQGEFDVFYTVKPHPPTLMREVGRLREETFRLVGEGTGHPLDLDRFDDDYLQLLVWNRDKNELVGGYRMGQSDLLLAAHGKDGLYTSTLFKFRKNLLQQISPALELGRSWVAKDYQRSFSPLMLLWKGIGAYMAANPKYRYIFGPVSISADYTSMSKQLLTAFLTMNRFLPDLGKLIRPRNPLSLSDSRQFDRKAFSTVAGSLEEINELVSELEADGKPMPVLLRQYLKLNGQLMGFNVDPDFGDVLDGLILIDVPAVDPRILKKYFGKEASEQFRRHHGMVE